MGRPKTKAELIEKGNEGFDEMWAAVEAAGEGVVGGPSGVRFAFDENDGKETHWTRDKRVRDVLTHLYEWHQLLIDYIKVNNRNMKAGKNLISDAVPFLPKPYNWMNYGEMNAEFAKKHKKTEYAEAVKMLKKSHKDVMKLAGALSEEALFEKKYFTWTGTTSLGAYFISVMSAHYEWATKKLKAHVRKMAKKEEMLGKKLANKK